MFMRKRFRAVPLFLMFLWSNFFLHLHLPPPPPSTGFLGSVGMPFTVPCLCLLLVTPGKSSSIGKPGAVARAALPRPISAMQPDPLKPSEELADPHYDGRALKGNLGLHHPLLHGSVDTPDNNSGAPHLYNRGSSMQVNSLHSEANDM